MCGIAGFLCSGQAPNTERAQAVVAAMAGTLVHRGPDGAGAWVDAGSRHLVAFGHQRLAVVGLSAAGHQPMTSADGRWTLNFNGEVYNHHELRRRLEQAGTCFRGGSDTEVLLEAIAHWGIERALAEVNGMFAFAVWDAREQRCFLARDRVGEKPLYYGQLGRTLLFGSELKALRAHPDFTGGLDRDGLVQYLRFGHVPAPRSIYRDVRKLPPGTMAVATVDGGINDPVPYWSAATAARAGNVHPFRQTHEADEVIDGLLRDSVALRMVADVPVGAFLSGGIDSSLVVALMQAQSSRPVRTFTIGFHEGAYDEAAHARAVAQHLGTEHTELFVTPDEAMEIVPRLPTVYDEPFADSSQIPTMLVSQLARRHVTVSLSGDGGDELFGGYTRYLVHARAARGLRAAPRFLRPFVASALRSVPPARWDRLAGVVPQLRNRRIGDRVHKAATLFDGGGPQQVYRGLVSLWADPAVLVNGQVTEPADAITGGSAWLEELDDIARLQLADLLTYLPDDILTKVDRASMSCSLEARVPMLDHRLVEQAWRVPRAMRLDRGGGKAILRRLLARHVPRELFERPKTGFGVPVGEWMRGPLRDWAEDLLSPQQLPSDGLLQGDLVRRAWDEHQTGQRNWQYQLWAVLMLQAWLAEEQPSPAADPT